MLRLVPVAEVWPRERWFDWAPPAPSHQWVELIGEATDEDVATVVALLASCNRIEAAGGVAGVARALGEAQYLILPGGLSVRAGKLEIPPSCCCGLETWREWYGVAPGGTSPWLGHSPSPWVECREEGAVIHADGEAGAASESVAVSYAELRRALAEAEAALAAFGRRLSQWLEARAPGTVLPRRFSEAFRIE